MRINKIVSLTLTAAFAMIAAACLPLKHQDAGPSSEEAILETSRGMPVDWHTFVREAAGANFILLGETHDNLAHHRIQAQILKAVVAQGRRPALVMEQFDLEQQPDVDRIMADNSVLENRLQRLSNLIGKGWDASAYRPLLEIALQSSLPITAANLSREAARDVGKQGFTSLGAEKARHLMLERVWLPEKQTALARTIRESHCGMLPESAVAGMVQAQRARDGVMADRLLQHRERGAVAIFGRGHVTKDMATPLYLSARDATAKTMAVGLIEKDAGDGNDRNQARHTLTSEERTNYDYIWFTPSPRKTGNPCDGFGPPPAATPPVKSR